MMKRFRDLAIFLSLVVGLGLSACQRTQQITNKSVEPSEKALAQEVDLLTDQTGRTEQSHPNQTQTPVNEPVNPVEWDKPPQSQAAEIRPLEMRPELTHLSNLMGYQVLDANGDALGVASDYIVNTCETYLIYLLMEPTASLNVTPGSRVVIPFEAVTINSGVLDAENKTIQLRLLPEQFSGAPTLSVGAPLTPTDWEVAARIFWAKMIRLGVLATSCNVPGGPVYKVAYASQLLAVALYDGQNNLLGVVQDAILEPESGKIGFYVVQPASGEGLVLVSLRVTIIPKEALQPGGTFLLVLLTDPKLFWEAPHITSLMEADDFAFQNKMRKYWDG